MAVFLKIMTVSTGLAISNECQALSLNIGQTGKFWWLFLMSFVDKDETTKVYISVHLLDSALRTEY